MATAVFSPYKANEGCVTHPRDASFSSYLDTTERNFVQSLAKTTASNSPSHVQEISSPRASSVGRNISRVQRSGELGVFGAEKYFNEKIDVRKGGNSPVVSRRDGGGGGINSSSRHQKRDDMLERKSSRSNISSTSSLKSPTPSLKSEGSFNNQIGFLLPKKGSVGHKIFSGFQCKGSCFSKKSVYTSNTHQMIQSSPKSYLGNVHRKSQLSPQEHFAFRIIDTAYRHLDPPRRSMEVFGLHQLGKQEIAQNLEKKLSFLAWNAIPNSPTTPFPISLSKKTSPCPSTIRTEDDDDVCSEASSDLFEIENLSGLPGSQTLTPNYAPSEGSIEWSVVTASATDNFSAFPNHDDDHKSEIPRGIRKNTTMKRGRVQSNSNNTGGMFLGCSNHKAVEVLRH